MNSFSIALLTCFCTGCVLFFFSFYWNADDGSGIVFPLPWQDNAIKFKPLGIALGHVSLNDVSKTLPCDWQYALYHKNRRIEAYCHTIWHRGLRISLILHATVSEQKANQLVEDKTWKKTQQGLRVKLYPEETLNCDRCIVQRLSYIPYSRLDKATIIKLWGAPHNRIDIAHNAQLWHYPNRALYIEYYAQNKTLFHFFSESALLKFSPHRMLSDSERIVL